MSLATKGSWAQEEGTRQHLPQRDREERGDSQRSGDGDVGATPDLVRDMLLFGGGVAFRVDQGGVGDQVSSVFHNEAPSASR